MARRIERTTGLPRPRPKERRGSAPTFAGITWTDRRRDLGILGAALFLALLVGGMLLYQFYDNTVLQPRTTVLKVGDQKFSLSYYTDRLLPFIQGWPFGVAGAVILYVESRWFQRKVRRWRQRHPRAERAWLKLRAWQRSRRHPRNGTRPAPPPDDPG